MMTLVEIKHSYAMKHLLWSMNVVVMGHTIHISLEHFPASRLPSLPIALYVLRNCYLPEAEQAPPLATEARLVALS